MKLLAIDSNSIINRAFYGVKPLTSRDGTPTNAIFGFFNIFLKLLDETSPDAVAFAFDLKAPTFRHKMYSEYKAQRKGMPQELAIQLPIVKDIISALGYKIVECEGFEADDILGSLAQVCKNNRYECVIATGDRDSMQLVDENVYVRLAYTQNGTPHSELFDVDAVIRKYGVSPRSLIEVKALMGDSSDNIPGVAGIGEKGATALISQFGSVENIYNSIDTLDIKESLRAKLIAGKDSAFMSRTLAEIVSDAPVSDNLTDYIPSAPDSHKATSVLAKLDMFKLIERLGLNADITAEIQQNSPDESFAEVIFDAPADEICSIIKDSVPDLLFDFDGDNISRAALIFKDKIFIVSSEISNFSDLLSSLLSSDIPKRTDNIKLLHRFAMKNDIPVKNVVFDLSLAGYLLSPSSSSYKISELTASYGLAYSNSEDSFAADASVFKKLCDILSGKIKENNMEDLLLNIELPLAQTLASMELIGFCVDVEGLKNYGEELSAEIDDLQKAIYLFAGCEFNINSPKQLADVLFGTLGLPAKKKTKNGYSTNADVLESLRSKHPIIDLILHYRRLAKLRSTYVDGFIDLCSDGKIHTTFIQTETRTGRISSVEPNMQNIPIRTDEGSKLRNFFIPSENMILIDADYSQIELRLLAHVADDEAMIDSFLSGADIHTRTAAQVFGVPEDFVTPQMRSRAKAVNFGIVYGIGAFSLSNDISVSVAEADRYIKNYLGYYSGVKNYMEKVVQNAKETGYVATLFGRRRYLPELLASNHNTRAFGERAAMNAPIQGGAADIIKLAMIRVFNRLRSEKLHARLILQVHDELIIEAPLDEVEAASRILKEEMENAASLSVPLIADIGVGKNWLDAK